MPLRKPGSQVWLPCPQVACCRKLRNLNSQKPRNQQQANLDRVQLNFGGRNNELWCEGGELAFILRMIRDSQRYAAQVLWFSTLVSKGENVAPLRKALQAARAVEVLINPPCRLVRTKSLVKPQLLLAMS